jgi:hypothetical protein
MCLPVSGRKVTELVVIARHRILVILAGACLVAVVCLAAGGSAAATSGSNDVSGVSDCSIRATLVRTVLIKPDGSPAPPGARPDRYAVKYVYRLNGSELSQVQPPRGWRPVGATDQELRTYGFPPRPLEPEARSVWNSDFSHWKKNIVTGMCESNTRS